MTTSPLPRFFALALLGAVLLAGCGGNDDEGGGGRVEELAECIDKTDARASTAESVAEGAIGAVDMLGPAAVIHVFEQEKDAKAYSDSESATQIGTVSVSSTNPAAVEIVRGCV
jgi:hypothetical protein